MRYTEEQKQFILENDGKMHRRDIQKRLGVSIDTVTRWCIELNGRKRSKDGTKNKHRKPIAKEGFFEHDYNISTI